MHQNYLLKKYIDELETGNGILIKIPIKIKLVSEKTYARGYFHVTISNRGKTEGNVAFIHVKKAFENVN